MSTAPDITATLPPVPHGALRRVQLGALLVGIVALAVASVGAFFFPGPFFRAYLVAFLFYSGLSAGSMVILMIYYLTGGAWGFLMRRALEAGMRTLPLAALMFVPLALGITHVYPWAQTHTEQLSSEWQRRDFYLNPAFFWGRATVIFLAYLLLALFLSLWSRHQDRGDGLALHRKLNGLAGPGLVVYGVVTMFAAVDWIMSLQPAFHSSIIGPVLASGHLLTAHAAALIVVAWLVQRQPLGRAVSDAAFADIGNLLFTFLIIWAYMEYFQFMLIWIADLPSDAAWYVPRNDGPWYWIVLTLFMLHFAVPFILLLFRAIAHNPRALTWVAGLLLLMHVVYLYVIVLPIYSDMPVWQHWIDPFPLLGLGGLWLACYLWTLERWPLLPLHDPNQAAALHFHVHDIQEQRDEQRDREVRHA